MVVMKVNERQVIYLFTDSTKILPNGDNLDHLGLETDNINAVREHLPLNYVADRDPMRSALAKELFRQELWWWFLIGVVLLLCGEIWMTRRLVKQRG